MTKKRRHPPGPGNLAAAADRPSPMRRQDSFALLGLVLFLATQYWRVLGLPFVNDDYFFLDKTRAAPFAVVWARTHLVFGWYRPWSAELHYWVLQRLYGLREWLFHLTSFALWLGAMMLYLRFARRLAGGAAAGVAAAGVASLALWGGPLIWIAGAQDLWMLLWTLLCLHAFARERRLAAGVALALALLSKESAASVPAVLVLYCLVIERRTIVGALRRTWPYMTLVVVWALAHPTLGARLWGSRHESMETAGRPSAITTALRTLLAQVNLDVAPQPGGEWGYVALFGILGAAALLLVLAGSAPATVARQDPSAPRPAGRAVVLFGCAWAAIGWVPLFLPSIGWHAYYGVFGTLGAWLAIGALLSSRRRGAALLVATLAVLLAARTVTPSWDWGSGWYQIRAASLLRPMRSVLLGMHPRVPPHSRLFFARIPNNVGFLAGDGPALRVWYADSTIQGRFYSEYAPRHAGSAPGPDYFFRFDSARTWVEILTGPEDFERAILANPAWERDHRILASMLARNGEYLEAAGEYSKLTRALPSNGEYPYYAAMAFVAAGRPADADSMIRESSARTGRTVEELRSAAWSVLGQRTN